MAKFFNHFYNTGRKTSSDNRQQNRSFFQAKLSVNQPNDIYEQEANAVAERINQPGDAIQPSFFPPVSIQRKCSHCEAGEEKMQRKENSNSAKVSLPGTESYIASLSGGKPLGSQEKTFFQSKIGYDFSDVRIHADTSANQSAKNINALAYTHGNDIVFNAGQYQPNTNEGKKLLAHELTHVIQQSDSNSLGNAPGFIQRTEGKDPSRLDDDQLKSEYDAYNEYVHAIDPSDYVAEEGNMDYFVALEKELKKRCIKSPPSHPTEVSQKLIDRITGKYAKIDGDPGEGLFQTPYVASEGQCTIGYGHVIYPKSSCAIKTTTTDEGKTKKTCECAPPWNAISKDQAIEYLKKDMQTHMNEVHNKIKVDLNQAEFDAMVDLSAHVGSLPSDFVNFVHEKWCTNKDAVREKYLRTAITMKDPDTKQYKVMKNFVERRKKRAW